MKENTGTSSDASRRCSEKPDEVQAYGKCGLEAWGLMHGGLSVCDISKTFRGDVQALRSVSFEVFEREFVSILGPSGCGKTTLLKVLIGLVKPDCGRILRGGDDITCLPPDKRGMGIVFQNYALFENMTALANVEYALKIKVRDRHAARSAALSMMETLGIANLADVMPSQLSGGQQQRVAIARTLCLKPDIILLDEPMSALDATTRISMRNELKRIQNAFSISMVCVTHDEAEAFGISDRVGIMRNGALLQMGTPEEIMQRPADDFVRSFVVQNLKGKLQFLSRFVR